MKKTSSTFSAEMMKLVQEKELDYLFVGEGAQVLSSSKMLQIILKMDDHEMIWKSLNGNPPEQENAIIKVREYLFEGGFSTDYESKGKFFYLTIKR